MKSIQPRRESTCIGRTKENTTGGWRSAAPDYWLAPRVCVSADGSRAPVCESRSKGKTSRSSRSHRRGKRPPPTGELEDRKCLDVIPSIAQRRLFREARTRVMWATSVAVAIQISNIIKLTPCISVGTIGVLQAESSGKSSSLPTTICREPPLDD